MEEYVRSDAARIIDSRGRRSVLLSSIPLRSRVGGDGTKPLSLDLEAGPPGELRPENPVTQIRIATDPRKGFTIGPDPTRLVTIVPLGIQEAAPDATVFAGQLLFARARPDADLLIRPSVDGVQTFEQLIGPTAPESFAYQLELTANQTARLEDGAVFVRQAGDVIVRSLPPVALDADRHVVPVRISLDNNVVRLHARHRDQGYRYPIAVDPDWSSSYNYHEQPGLGLQGWYATGEAEYYDAAINNVFDPVADPGRDALGFVIRPIVTGAARTFPIGVGRQLSFNAPGTTHIRSVTYDHVSRFNDRDRQTLRLGLYGGGFGEADDVFEAEELSEASVTLPRTPFPDGEDTPATSAVMWMYTSPCNPGDLNCPPVLKAGTRTLLKVGSVQLELTDFDFPSTEAPGDLRELQDRWTNTTQARTLDPSAIDEGSGVRDLEVRVDDAAGSHLLRSTQAPCHPNHDQPTQENRVCPRTLTLDEPLSVETAGLLDGRSTFTVDASDMAGNTAEGGATSTTFSIYLDRNAPTTTVSGELFDAGSSWLTPRRSSSLMIAGVDAGGGQGRTSGIAHNHLRAVDGHGTTVLDRAADTCTPQGPIAAPCDAGEASTFSVDPRTLPEGPITFTATSTDLASNVSDAVTWTLRIDRTPPAARATGDLIGLTSQHTNSTTATRVTLHGRDASSGVARLQLVASNSDGERVLADRDTCRPDDVDPSDGSCPHAPSVEVSVDPGELPDGQTTFIARAIDHAGLRSVDNQDWDTYVDHTPPDAPDSIEVTQTSNTTVQITWSTVVDQPLGSGGVSYEYLVTAGGQPVGGWQPTGNAHAQVGGLPPGVTISILVRAIDAAHNVGDPQDALYRMRSTVGYTAEQIKRGFRLDELRGSAEVALDRLVAKGGTTAALRAALKNLVRFAGPVGAILTFIESYLTGKGDLHCQQGPILRQGGIVFANAGRVLRSVPGTPVSRFAPIAEDVVSARAALSDLERRAARDALILNDEDCTAPANTALGVIARTAPALDAALRQLVRLSAKRVTSRGPAIGRHKCEDARDLVRGLVPGKKRPNYVVYWSPPAPPHDFFGRYVGISRALDSRCSSHPAGRRRSLETLNLPPLYHAEATNVEEALITHFGLPLEQSVPPGRTGQLSNRIHAISSLRTVYCVRLLAGQAILEAFDYDRYAVPHFTRSARCISLNP